MPAAGEPEPAYPSARLPRPRPDGFNVKAKNPAEFQDGLQEFTGKIFAANFSIANNNKIVGRGKLLAGALQFAHQKYLLVKQQDAGWLLVKRGARGAALKKSNFALASRFYAARRRNIHGQDAGRRGRTMGSMGNPSLLFCQWVKKRERPFTSASRTIKTLPDPCRNIVQDTGQLFKALQNFSTTAIGPDGFSANRAAVCPRPRPRSTGNLPEPSNFSGRAVPLRPSRPLALPGICCLHARL